MNKSCSLITILSLLVLMFSPSRTWGGENWGEWYAAKDKSGIKVEARKNRDTGVLQTRTTATLNCPTNRVWELVVTEKSFLELFPDMQVSRQLKDQDETSGWWYQKISRSMISDRDYTLLVEWSIEETPLGKKFLRWWSVDNGNGPAPEKDVIRLDTNNGSWSLTPVAVGKTRFEYINYCELKGALPGFITRGAAKDNAFEFFLNLRQACEEVR